jgi:hypothetical protein
LQTLSSQILPSVHLTLSDPQHSLLVRESCGNRLQHTSGSTTKTCIWDRIADSRVALV